jgi:hypothetical protein
MELFEKLVFTQEFEILAHFCATLIIFVNNLGI